MDINQVNIIGRLTRDPELNYTKDNTAICKFSIASNGMKQDEVGFFNVTAWSKTGESCSKFLHKGSQVAINGFLHQNRWKDKEGNNKSTIDINARNVQFLGGKSDAQPNTNAPPKESTQENIEEVFTEVNQDELPF